MTLIVTNLPAGCGPAIDGTSDGLQPGGFRRAGAGASRACVQPLRRGKHRPSAPSASEAAAPLAKELFVHIVHSTRAPSVPFGGDNSGQARRPGTTPASTPPDKHAGQRR
ncbi:hypothetical protein [Streptomyces sp. NPDC048438]|uniref:hypothetical protein n=1 Tax=Streptomyces sp. NPDC048438 TaxID=3365551 RepID=UPI003719E46A